MKGTEVKKSITVADRRGKFLTSDLWIGHFHLKVKTRMDGAYMPFTFRGDFENQ